jgi:NAD-dependent DNA ligase
MQVYELIMADLIDLPGPSMDDAITAIRNRFQTLAVLKVATADQLTEINGIGKSRARTIVERIASMTSLDMTIASTTGVTKEEVEEEFEEFAQEKVA